jgi:hypothetical protein
MSGETSFLSIDPDGDITLEFSRSGARTHLQVSSKILSLASPVFARMFKSQFAEGLNNHPTSANSVVIPLPDEDEEAFTVICNALHYRMGSTIPNLSTACLENIAVICDKWDFVNAISPSAEIWLFNINYKECQDLPRYLIAAYLLDAPCAFGMISWDILMNQVGTPDGLHCGKLDDFIPINLLGTLCY